jgi:hypothetical protein
MSEHLPQEISQAVLQAILYSDVFDFPLNAYEVHRYLPGFVASYQEVYQILTTDPNFVKRGDHFALVGREEIVSLRKQRESHSKKLLAYALKYGRMIGSLPFIRMVALTGSLAVLNISKNADFDYMLITQPGRLWSARAFVLLFGRLTKLFGHTICPNLIVSENSLEWYRRDLYSAHEFCQMIPVTGRAIYQKLLRTNEWIKDFLPNAYMESDSLQFENPSIFQKLLEFLLRSKLGDRFEQWEMNRKIARFSKQEGFGEETIFTSDVCQGNFEHHRKWTEEQLEQRTSKFKDEGIRVREI